MKKSKKFGLLSLLLVGVIGISTASAFIIADAVNKNTTGGTDSGILLDWDSASNVGAIETLSPGSPQYREVSLAAPVKSTGVTANAGLIVKLEAGAAPAKVDGVSVEVAKASWSIQGTTAEFTVNTTTPELSSVVTVATTFYLKISITQAAFDHYLDSGNTDVLGGVITLSYGIIA